MKKYIFLICLMVGIGFSQVVDNYDSTVVRNNDSILYKNLYEVKVYSERTFARKKDQRMYDRLIRICKKVYPYAKLAGVRMEEYGAALDTMKKKDVKKLVAQFEEEVQNKYGGDLKRMTFSEGRILLRLLDRETKHSGYEIVKELKSVFHAFFFQALAELFDYDLKSKFDPKSNEEDMYIDEICYFIDIGKY